MTSNLLLLVQISFSLCCWQEKVEINSESVLWIGDYLPTVYEVAQTIYNYSKNPKTNKREETVTIYTKSLRCLWIQAFGDRLVVSYPVLRNKVLTIMQDYNTVYSR